MSRPYFQIAILFFFYKKLIIYWIIMSLSQTIFYSKKSCAAKKRRELENVCYDDLAELNIGADMRSTKIDKTKLLRKSQREVKDVLIFTCILPFLCTHKNEIFKYCFHFCIFC